MVFANNSHTCPLVTLLIRDGVSLIMYRSCYKSLFTFYSKYFFPINIQEDFFTFSFFRIIILKNRYPWVETLTIMLHLSVSVFCMIHLFSTPSDLRTDNYLVSPTVLPIFEGNRLKLFM